MDSIHSLAKTIFTAAEDAKAEKPVVFQLEGLVSFTDYLIICSASNDRQVGAISDRIEGAVKKDCGRKPLSIEGFPGCLWVLMDYGDIVVHIFLDEMREFYRLEEMWKDAPRIDFNEKAKPIKKKSKPTKSKPTKVKAVKKKTPVKKPVKKKAPLKKSPKKTKSKKK